MKYQDGKGQLPESPATARAYCAGRAAAVAGSLITVNPHVADTPEYLAFNRGWRLWAAGGTTTFQDNCDQPAKYTAPTFAATLDATDLSGRTYDFVTTPALPVTYLFGDGSAAVMAETGTAKHQFPDGGDFSVSVAVLAQVTATNTVSVTYARLTIQPSMDLAAATDTVVATYTENGIPVASKSIAAVSADEEVFTVATPVVTDAAGEAEFTLTSIGPGGATLTVTAASGPEAVCLVTVPPA
jgi:hypothetical protein